MPNVGPGRIIRKVLILASKEVDKPSGMKSLRQREVSEDVLNRTKLDKMWNYDLQLAQLELHVKRVQLIVDWAKLISPLAN